MKKDILEHDVVARGKKDGPFGRLKEGTALRLPDRHWDTCSYYEASSWPNVTISWVDLHPLAKALSGLDRICIVPSARCARADLRHVADEGRAFKSEKASAAEKGASRHYMAYALLP